MTSTPAEETIHPAAGTHAVGHATPFWLLVATLAALLMLTAITVGVTWIRELDFGRVGSLLIALVIATIKATLVALYFMHVRHEKPIVGVILFGALLFVAVFVGAALLDTTQYQPNIQEWRDVDPNTRYAPALHADQPGGTP
jgi:cytochrome c oxidase subunit 4